MMRGLWRSRGRSLVARADRWGLVAEERFSGQAPRTHRYAWAEVAACRVVDLEWHNVAVVLVLQERRWWGPRRLLLHPDLSPSLARTVCAHFERLRIGNGFGLDSTG